MPIELRTGLPGAGKTLGAVESLMQRRKLEPDRPLYQHGITDLRDGLAIPLTADEVQRWDELPPGAVLYIDECQKLMPAKRGTGNSPDWIRKLSEHRHLGLDFVFITQHPSLIDNYVRTLVDRHVHTIRSYGTKAVERYTWPLCVSDPNSKTHKKSAEGKSRHVFDKQAMLAYKSSELHTIKPRIPKFIKICALLLVLVPLLGFIAYKVMHRVSDAHAQSGHADNGGKDTAISSDGGGSQTHTISKEEWIHRQIPRVAGIPWSAPIFDDQKVQTQPDLYCIQMEGDHGETRCDCVTEQGTHAEVPHAMCMAFVKGGVYNPYRKPLDTQFANKIQQGEDTRTPGSQNRAESVATGGSSANDRRRHGFNQQYTPPEEMEPIPMTAGHIVSGANP